MIHPIIDFTLMVHTIIHIGFWQMAYINVGLSNSQWNSN